MVLQFTLKNMNKIVLISFWKISFKYDKYVENWIFCIDEPVFKIITVFEKKTTSNYVLN